MRRYFLFVFVAVAVICMLFLGGRRMLAQSSLAPQMIAQAVDNSKLVTLRGNVYPAARAENDRGIAPANMEMNHMMLVLNRSAAQQAALDTLDAQQADKSSPNFHKWLTPQQFGQQFGASDEDINTITSWLESEGFQVNDVPNGRNMIDFSGTTENIREAFHTEIHHFVVNGQDHYANVSDPQIPAALASIVAGINRLNDFRPRPMSRKFGTVKMTMPSRKIAGVAPEFTFNNPDLNCFGSNTPCYGVGPYDLATIYNALPVWNANCPNTSTKCNGAGINIAIVSDSDIRDVDYQQFRTLMGLPAFPGTNGTINRIVPPGVTNPGIQGTPPCTADTDEDEAVLDVEWAGGMAPGSQVDLVMAPTANSCGNPSTSGETGLPSGDTFGGDYAAVYAVNSVNDPILTDSYGECELLLGAAANTFYDNLWQQANTQGITVITATGDNGSAGCDTSSATSPAQDGLEVNGAASTPYDTAVGGTDFAYGSAASAATYWNSANSASGTSSSLSAKGPIPETVYNDSCTNPAYVTALGASSALNACNSLAAQEDGLIGPVGSSGGASSCTSTNGGGIAPSDCKGGYAKPSWQTGTGVPNDSARDIPDISLFSGDGNGPSVTFYIICEEDLTSPVGGCSLSPASASGPFYFQAEGGTSVAAQGFAGIVAVLDQYQSGVQGKAVRLGSAAFNANLYALANAEGASNCNNSTSTPLANSANCPLKDVTTGTNSMPCVASGTNCGTSVTSHALPYGGPADALRWTTFDTVLLGCVSCALTLMFLLSGKRRRWSAAFALVLFAALIGSVSCGGGSYNGTGGGGGGGGGTTNTIGVLSGYNAGAGYDRATGLGSVNVSELVQASGW